MSALEVIRDLAEDPKNNGEYELHLKGEQFQRLWDAAQTDAKIIERAKLGFAEILARLDGIIESRSTLTG